MKFYHLETEFNFGKHRGKTLKEVIQINGTITINGEKVNLPNENSYIEWCILNIDTFFIGNKTIKLIKQIKPNFYLSENALDILNEKYEEWIEEQRNYHTEQISKFSINEYSENTFNNNDNYCGACMESPCMCSDPGW